MHDVSETCAGGHGRLVEAGAVTIGLALVDVGMSCHRFVANRVRLSLFVLAYNLGNFLRRLFPQSIPPCADLYGLGRPTPPSRRSSPAAGESATTAIPRNAPP